MEPPLGAEHFCGHCPDGRSHTGLSDKARSGKVGVEGEAGYVEALCSDSEQTQALRSEHHVLTNVSSECSTWLMEAEPRKLTGWKLPRILSPQSLKQL